MLTITFFLIFLLAVIAAVVAFLVILFTTSVIAFARVAFALAIALIVSYSDLILVADNSFLNFIAWAIIFIGIICLLSTLPKVDKALRFLCTILMSVLAIELVVLMLGNVIAGIIGQEFVMNTLYEIIVKIICSLVAAWGIITQTKSLIYTSPSNRILYILERLLASLMYGIAITFLCLSLHGNWNLPAIFILLIPIGGTIAAFIADIHLADKDIFGSKETQEVFMPK